MRPQRAVLLAVLVAAAAAPATLAQQALIAPAGRSAEQVSQDQADCRSIATSLTGFDPAQTAVAPPPATPAPTPPAPKGGRVRGAARGAAAGAVVAEARTPDVGNGELESEYKEERIEDAAKVGAVAGGAAQRQGRRQAASQQQAAQQQAAEAQTAQQEQLRASYDLASQACLMGRGYRKN